MKTNVMLISIILSVFIGAEIVSARPMNRQGKPARLEQARRTLRNLESRVRLARSTGEFVNEMDLFDNHLYGRVDASSGRNRADMLQEIIRVKNVELNHLMDNPPRDFSSEGTNVLTPDTRMYLESVHNLETEIAGMLSDLNDIRFTQSHTAANELLSGSVWRPGAGDELLADPLGGETTRALERARSLVDSLETTGGKGSLQAPGKMESKGLEAR